MLKNTVQLDSLESLSTQSNLIAMEAFALPLPSVGIKGLMSGFVNNLTGFMDRVFTRIEKPLVRLDAQNTVKLIAAHNYLDLYDTPVFVPQGLSVPMLDHLATLEVVGKTALSVLDSTINPLNQWVGAALNNPGNLKSIMNVPTVKIMEIEKAKKLLANDLKSRNTSSERVLGEMVKRGGDWQHLFDNAERLAGSIQSVKPEQVTARTKVLLDNLDLLIQKVKGDPAYQMSSPALSSLSKCCYQVAEAVEFYGVFVAQYIELATALNDSADSVKQHVK